MAIPFLKYFKKAKAEKTAASPVAPPPPPIDKPSSERFSKTVMPNASRNVQSSTPAYQPPPVATAVAAAPGGPRKIAFDAAPPPAAPARGDLPPAVALALEPKVERVIALTIGDILPLLPPALAKPAEALDLNRRVLLKAAEVERGMASGKPTVSLASIHHQMPEMFESSVSADDTRVVQLPFAKVLEEFTKLQVRTDQVRQTAVPQVETPFLKVTLEDNARFGMQVEHLETTGHHTKARIASPISEPVRSVESAWQRTKLR